MKDVYASKPWVKSYDSGVRSSIEIPNTTVGQSISAIIRDFPEKMALNYMGVPINYKDLGALGDRFANFLVKHGCQPGDVVGYYGANIPAGYIAMVGIHKAGCVYSGVSPLLTPDELKYQLNDSGVKVLVAFEPLYGVLVKILGDTGVKAVLVTRPTDYIPNVPAATEELAPIPGIEVKRFVQGLDEMSSNPIFVQVSPDDPCCMLYTGGTTGAPKGAVTTNKCFIANVAQVREWLQMKSEEEVIFTPFPIFHAAGTLVASLALLTGATYIVLPNPRDSAYTLKALKQFRPTFIAAVPTIYVELMKLPEFRTLDISFIKHFFCGSSPYPADDMRELEKVVGKGRLMEGYGMTETVCFALSNPDKGLKKLGSIGLPMANMEARLVNPDTGEIVGLGEEGELLLKGPQVMKGYHNKQEETANSIRNGWLHTGDVAKMDEDGYFYIVDRLKDMISVSGLKVFSRVVDDELTEHPDVEMGATVGLPDPERPGSEIVACAIILRPGVEKSNATKEKITEFLKGKLAPYKVPKVIEFVDQLPLSAVGKILKRDVRKMMQSK